MSGDKKESGILGQIAVAVVVAIVAGGSSPWWLDRFFPNNNLPNPQHSGTISTSPKVNINPLQVGQYESYNNYLDVFQKGERICMRATSNNGSTVASVYVNSNDPNIYQIANYSDSMQLKQIDSTTISFGGRNYTKQGDAGFPQNTPDIVQKCLDSTDIFFDHIPREEVKSEVQSESSTANIPASPSEVLKVQNLSDGDYYFKSGEAPHYSDAFRIFRKRDNTIVGWSGVHDSGGGACFRTVILSNSQVETTTIAEDPFNGDGRVVQVYTEVSKEDGNFGSPELSQVDVNKYPNFDGTIRGCADKFPN